MQQIPELDPPQRLLLGPGPANIHPRVAQAMAAPLVGHLDPYFLKVMEESMQLLRELYGTRNHHTIPISGTGSAGLQAIMDNLLEPGDEAVVGIIGYFGDRLAEMAARTGATVRTVAADWGGVIAPEQVEAELRRRPAKLVALVHAETSTGAHQPLGDIAALAHRHGALLAADCVTSLGGMPVSLDDWGVDAAGSCSQKCLGAPPGLGPVSFGPRALAAVRARTRKVPSWYLDLTLLFQYWGEEGSQERVFHHTAPVASIYAFREAMRLIAAEGPAARFARHQRAHVGLAAGLSAMGLSLFTPAAHRLPMLNVVNVPAGVEEAAVRRRMLAQGIEISGAFGQLKGRAWRIGLMGHNAQAENVLRLLSALELCLAAEGHVVPRGTGADAAAAALAAG